MAPTALNIENGGSNGNGIRIGGRPVRIANCSGSKGASNTFSGNSKRY
jgi:hypothetical protein